MATPRVLVFRAPGTNCDEETAFAFNLAGARADIVHVNRVLEAPNVLADYQILCIAGGFSYGDDIAAGRILGNQLGHHLVDHIKRFRDDGKLILGICNGFQVLLKTGLLLDESAASAAGATNGAPQATLAWNALGRFEDRWVQLEVFGNRSEFLRGVERMYLPVAHAEGQFVFRDDATMREMNERGQLVLRYAAASGKTGGGQVAYPDNPNGSQMNVAGISDATGRVLGLMPHPERHVDRTHHPRWTRGEGTDPGDGLRLFENAVNFFS